jgi:hypothetical protein
MPRAQRQASLAGVRRPQSAPATRKRPGANGGPRAVLLINADWERMAAPTSRTVDETLALHTLEGTRDVKLWEQAVLQDQLAELEAGGLDRWLETTKRGLGLFLCLAQGGKLVVSGLGAGSSAEEAGIVVGCEVHAINGQHLHAGDGGQSVVLGLLSTVAHRRVELLVSQPAADSPRLWYPFPEFKELVIGAALVTIEHCCHCKDHQVGPSQRALA